jgi:hypothetical protein
MSIKFLGRLNAAIGGSLKRSAILLLLLRIGRFSIRMLLRGDMLWQVEPCFCFSSLYIVRGFACPLWLSHQLRIALCGLCSIDFKNRWGFSILLCSSNISSEEQICLLRVAISFGTPLKVWRGWQLDGLRSWWESAGLVWRLNFILPSFSVDIVSKIRFRN